MALTSRHQKTDAYTTHSLRNSGQERVPYPAFRPGQAGVAGLGVLWLLDYMVTAHVARGELVRLFDDWQMAPMALTIAYSPNRHVSARLRVFMDWVAAVVAVHAPLSAQLPA